MALPFARSQLVRYLTDKVIENVTKQLADQQAAQQQQLQAPSNSEGLPPASSDLQRLVESINAAFAQTYDQIEALEGRIGQVEGRMRRLERRWGWTMVLRIVVAVVVAFLLGFLAWLILSTSGLLPFAST